MARRDNRWTGTRIYLNLGPLRPDERGQTGVLFAEASFAGAEPEVFLRILEPSPWAEQYGVIGSLGLFASAMLLETTAGPVALVLWRLTDGGKTLVHYEHPLDPLAPATRELLLKVESQLELKVVLRENLSGITTGFWCLENTFRMGDLAKALGRIRPRGPVAPFPQRNAALLAEYTSEDLVALAQRQNGG